MIDKNVTINNNIIPLSHYKFIKDLTFTKERNFFQNRLELIPRYRTKEEKEALLLEDGSELYEYFEKLCPKSPIKPINTVEYIAFIFKARSISVSDEISLVLNCSKCKAVNDVKIEIDDIIKIDKHPILNEKFMLNFPIGLFEEVEEILDDNTLENLSIYQYDLIHNLIRHNTELMLNLQPEWSCRIEKCKFKNNVIIDPIAFMSKVNLSGLYTEIFNLSFYSSNSIPDIEQLYPFERNIYLQLTKKEVDKRPVSPLTALS